jgi:hypothetical protein
MAASDKVYQLHARGQWFSPGTPYSVVRVSFIGGGNWSTRRKSPTCHKSLTNFITASDKVYQLHARGQWFSPGTPASSTTKTGRHDIAEILLKVANEFTSYIYPPWQLPQLDH